MILKTSQMLNLNMELLDHYIGSLKIFREKCKSLERGGWFIKLPESFLVSTLGNDLGGGVISFTIRLE